MAQEPRYASSGFNLLYKDGALSSVVDRMDQWWHYKALIRVARGEIEDREKQKERLRRTPVPKFDDDANVREFFRVKSLRGDDIPKSMPEVKKRILQEEREHQARERRNPPDPGLTVVITAFNLLNPSVPAEMRRAYKINAEFIKKFDAAKVPIGMSEAQVNELFGPPTWLLASNFVCGRGVFVIQRMPPLQSEKRISLRAPSPCRQREDLATRRGLRLKTGRFSKRFTMNELTAH